MRNLTLGVLAVALMLSPWPTRAAAGRITGVIASVTEQPTPSMQVKSKEAGTREIRTDNNTSYTKWIIHKPMGQAARLDRKSLVVGRCVDVELPDKDGFLAKAVRISDEPSGSLYDPCKALR
jgi:hypothetical protein